MLVILCILEAKTKFCIYMYLYARQLTIIKSIVYLLYCVESFECSSRSSSSIGSVLNNIYWYYSQFSSAVENHLKDSAHPLEKEFKVSLT